MNRLIKGSATALLMSAGLASAALGLGGGTAQADNSDWGPAHHWCPGQPLPDTGNRVTMPLKWDMTICHTYYYTYPYGNVTKTIWDGDNPPRSRRRLTAFTAMDPRLSQIAISTTTHTPDKRGVSHGSAK